MRLRSILPDARDLHVYGGGALVAVGAWIILPGAGLVAFGALLVYLGLRTPR
jgi:hypothetical protein